MKKFSMKGVLLIVSMLCLSLSIFADEIQNDLLQSLRAGNAKEIASRFSTNVTVTIKNETGVFSKYQAEMLLNDFFKSNKATEVKQIQRVPNTNSSGYYIVYQFKNGSNDFRFLIRFVESSGTHQISELRVE